MIRPYFSYVVGDVVGYDLCISNDGIGAILLCLGETKITLYTIELYRV